ncbi:hypothetical protein XELAEV_18045689mg [Xenopus laevis]|uniref:VWFA domain-containing protein n=1 Tax=Xenopus laevis TaxID=8355 RepID=A0A974C250_XENLA|nr:hypothetical protein XELAEV_18045689mg [Xenopus laevis]
MNSPGANSQRIFTIRRQKFAGVKKTGDGVKNGCRRQKRDASAVSQIFRSFARFANFSAKQNCANSPITNHLGSSLLLLQIRTVSRVECTVPSLDIVFLIDGSGSIEANEFQDMLIFVSKVIEDFEGTDMLLYAMSLFISRGGSREGSQKVLIVITDGRKYKDSLEYPGPIAEAELMGVVRFAIGVGKAFDGTAFTELTTIASRPSDKYVYRVSDFSALSKFRKDLHDKIFAIEGVQVQTGSGFHKEMSQDGFSSALSSNLTVIGAVGAFNWSGGASVYTKGQTKSIWINETQNQKDMKAAYLGYSVHQLSPNLIAIGAPRYQHTGSVLIYEKDLHSSKWNQRAVISGEKIGSYFGSVLNGGFVNSQLLLLVGAPTYYTPNTPGGRVFLCHVNTSVSKASASCPVTLQGDPTLYFGHFGSAMCLLPDLIGDKLIDLAVGAPYEDQNQGAIYIFPGQKEGFRTAYIQCSLSLPIAPLVKPFTHQSLFSPSASPQSAQQYIPPGCSELAPTYGFLNAGSAM